MTSEILQLAPLAKARENPNDPLLRWTTRVADADLAHFKLNPNAAPGDFLDRLWEYSVSELFLANPDASQYFEFEMTPAGHWVAIALKAPRVRAPGHRTPAAKHWTDVRRLITQDCFGMEFSYARLAPLLANNRLRVQCCLSLGGGRYFLAPHWKNDSEESDSTWDNGRPPRANADFHQPSRYWLVKLEE